MDQSKYMQLKAIQNECKNLSILINQLSSELDKLRQQNSQSIEDALVQVMDTNISVPLFIPLVDWAHSRCALSILALQNLKQFNPNPQNILFQIPPEDEEQIRELQQRKQKLIDENLNLKQELDSLRSQAENEKKILQRYLEMPFLYSS